MALRWAAAWCLIALVAGGCRKEALLVSAAISLKEPVEEIARHYEREHAGEHVALNFAASGALARQIEGGAPVDVFLSADERSMLRLRARGRVSAFRHFASNRLVLITARGQLAGLRFTTLAGDPRLKRLAIGTPAEVPAGEYATTLLRALGELDALEARLIPASNVRQVLDYVARGEADAGIVYATDARLASAVEIRDTQPPDPPLDIFYASAVVDSTRRPAAAAAFDELVHGPVGHGVLAAHGFLPP